MAGDVPQVELHEEIILRMIEQIDARVAVLRSTPVPKWGMSGVAASIETARLEMQRETLQAVLDEADAVRRLAGQSHA